MRYKFIDKITHIENDSITGIKCLSLNEDIFQDHFENSPMYPAAMMTESSVELMRFFIWDKSDFELTALPTSFNKFKFYKTALPGQQIKIELHLQIPDGHLLNNTKFNVKSIGTVNNEKIFDGLFTAMTFSLSALHEKQNAINDMNILRLN